MSAGHEESKAFVKSKIEDVSYKGYVIRSSSSAAFLIERNGKFGVAVVYRCPTKGTIEGAMAVIDGLTEDDNV